MSPTTTSTPALRARGLIAAAILAALTSSFGAVCHASAALPKATVRFADLDISTPQGAAGLYSRIRSASEGLCAPFDRPDNLSAVSRWKMCVKHAIEGAVTEVNQPALSAVYAAKYGVLQPANILTADRR